MGLFTGAWRRRALEQAGVGEEALRGLRRSDVENLLEDLAAGAKYQQALLPKEPPAVAGYDLAAWYRPARTLSGDFYDLLPLGDGRLAVVIADASGKSIPASLVAMMCHLLFRVRPEPAASPARVLSQVNGLLLGNVKRGTFVSGIYAVLDPAQHTLTVANAGHLPVVVWHSKEKLATTHREHGAVLGVLPTGPYEVTLSEEVIPLAPGDRFVMLTDGVNEAMAPGEKEFGMEHLRLRLKALSEGTSSDFLKALTDQIDLHRAGSEQSDDITLVTGRRLS